MMKMRNIRWLSRVLCVVMLAALTLEAPLMAAPAPETVPVKFPATGEVVRVGAAHYQDGMVMRTVNGQTFVVEIEQYIKWVMYDIPPTNAKVVPTPTGNTSAGTSGGTSGGTPNAPSGSGATGGSSGLSGAAAGGQVKVDPNYTVPGTGENAGLVWDMRTQRWHDPANGYQIVKGGAGPSATAPSGNTGAGGNTAGTPGSTGDSGNTGAAGVGAASGYTIAGSGENSGLVWDTRTQRWHDPANGYRVVKGGPAPNANGQVPSGSSGSSGASGASGNSNTGAASGHTIAGSGENSGLVWDNRTQRWHDPANGYRVVKGGPAPDANGMVPSGNTGGTSVNDPDGAGVPGGTKTPGSSGQSGQSGQGGVIDGPDGPAAPYDPADPPLPDLPDGPDGQVAGGSNQSGQNGQSGQGGQSGQSGQGGQTGGDATGGVAAGQSAQAGQSGGSQSTIGSKFRAGYDAGKAMTNQGFQNVKDSLKSGFSPKNILVTAGITVGVDLATQVFRGEKPSIKKALKTVATAEFAGGVVGSVTGAAAGSFFVPFLSAVPVVGGLLGALAPTFGAVVGSSMGAYLAGDLKNNGRFSVKAALKQVDWVGVTGQAIGSTIGAALGSALGPVGTIIGGMAGGFLGNWLAHKIAGVFGKDNQQRAGAGQGAMPVGSTPYTTYTGGPVSIGNNVDGNLGQATGVDPVVVGGNSAPVGTYASEVQMAYARYQEIYHLYNELLNAGRDEDAQRVAVEVRKAKAEYDRLRAQSGK